jgi:hypothetical protein
MIIGYNPFIHTQLFFKSGKLCQILNSPELIWTVGRPDFNCGLVSEVKKNTRIPTDLMLQIILDNYQKLIEMNRNNPS